MNDGAQSEIVCANPDCKVAQDGKCVEGVDRDKCTFYGRSAAAEAVPAAKTPGIQLPSAASLDLEQASWVLCAEATFQAKFPSALEKHVNEEFRHAWATKRGDDDRVQIRGDGERIPQVQIRLVSIQEGSLKAILDIIGINDNDLRSFILLALEMYSPMAFNEAMNVRHALRADAKVIGDEPRLSAPPITSGMTFNNPALMRALTSFLIPISLVFVIFFFAFNSLTRELSELKIEAAAVRTERTEILKAVVDQNKSISASLAENSKAAMASTKALEELLVSLITKKAAEPGLTPKP